MAKPFSRSLGSYVSKSNLVNGIKALASRTKNQEDEERLLDEVQSGSLRAEDVHFVVINEQQGDRAYSDPHRFPLGLSPVQLQYLKDKPPALTSIQQKLKDKGFNCIFDLEAGNVHIRTLHGHSEREALQMIENSIVEMDFDSEMMAVIDDMQVFLPTQKPGDVEALVVKAGSSVKIVGMAEDFAEIRDSFRASKDKLNAQASAADIAIQIRDNPNSRAPVPAEENKEESVQTSESCCTYIYKYKWDEITSRWPDVILSIQDRSIIKLQGRASAVTEAGGFVGEIVSQVKIFQVNLGPKMNVAVISQVADEIGKKFKCSITFQQNFGCQEDRSAPVPIPTNPSLNLSVYGLKEARVKVVVNAIEKQKAHVIVNTTNTELELHRGRGVSWCILEAAGPSIKTELVHKYPEGIQHGEVAETGPGNIRSCKTIYHGALPQFPKGTKGPDFINQENECFKWLVSLVFNCLIKASRSERGYLTIALPAFGTGNLEFPAQHVVQLMYKAIKLFKDDKRSGQIKEIIIVIHPDTTPEVKQMFLAHRQTHKLNTRHVASLDQMREENARDDGEGIQNCEIRVVVETSLLQVVNGSIQEACDVSEAVLILWSDEEIKDQKSNKGLMCTDPGKTDWNCSPYIGELDESKCTIDSKSLQRRTLIHCYCPDYKEKPLTDAIIRGITKAASLNYNTVTIPIATDGHLGEKPLASAKVIRNAVTKARANIYVVTVVIEDGAIFENCVGNVAEHFAGKLHPPADVDKSPVAVDLWKKTHAERASRSHASLQAMLTMTNKDSVVLIASDSEDNNKKAAKELQGGLTSKLQVVIEETDKVA